MDSSPGPYCPSTAGADWFDWDSLHVYLEPGLVGERLATGGMRNGKPEPFARRGLLDRTAGGAYD
jgi:hypothetical protein